VYRLGVEPTYIQYVLYTGLLFFLFSLTYLASFAFVLSAVKCGVGPATTRESTMMFGVTENSVNARICPWEQVCRSVIVGTFVFTANTTHAL
jgi:hypothetical protein